MSRQLWWGHRIPTWSGYFTDEVKNKLRPELVSQLVADSTKIQSPLHKAAFGLRKELADGVSVSLTGKAGNETIFGYATGGTIAIKREAMADWVFAATTSELEAHELEKLGFTQDPDVLDTWFSSWLWPFATMGWPEQTDTCLLYTSRCV